MNKYNEEYYIAFEPKGDNQPYVIADKKTTERGYHYKKVPLGGLPFFFYNRNKEKDRRNGKKWPITEILETGGDFLVNDFIRDEVIQYDIDGMQLYPSVYIDDDDNWHENYWFLNFYETFVYWDQGRSEIVTIDENDDKYGAEIDKYCLDEKKLFGIPEEKRLIFKMSGVGDPYVFFHQKIVDFLMTNNCRGIRFFKVSEFEEGDQFKRRAKFLQS